MVALGKTDADYLFQSTLPAGGATSTQVAHWLTSLNFNPRSPQGERLAVLLLVPQIIRFQSTLPAGGAT